jgi:hypothetical protein
MIDLYLTSGAYKVTKGPVTLYSGLSSGALTLTGTWPVNGSRLAIVASAVTGHADCSGTVVINGSETITFTQAGRKTSAVSLVALPMIVTTNLDCNLVITVLDSGLAPTQVETQTAINTRIEPHQSGHSDASGAWTTVNDTQIFSDTMLNVGDVVRKSSRNYTIKQVDENLDLGGEVAYYTYLA